MIRMFTPYPALSMVLGLRRTGKGILPHKQEKPTVADHDIVEVERGTPEWDDAWEGLGKRLRELEWGDGSDLVQMHNHSGWKLVVSRLQGGQIVHTFRHRDHPKTGRRQYVLVSLPREEPKTAGKSTDYLAKELLELETRAKALRSVALELFRDKVLLYGERAAVDIIASYIWIARDLIRAAGEREIQREIEDNKEG